MCYYIITMKKGLLIVCSGPSGVGKGTILKRLMDDASLNLVYSVSMTTRKPRVNEINGVNYFFVSEKEFKEAIENKEMLEYAQFVGNYYGTPIKYVEEKRNQGFNVVLEIEVEGAKQVLSKQKDCLSIFISPPSLKELERRIRERQTEDEETILKRLRKAEIELKEIDNYRYVVCNDDIEKAIKEIKEIITKHYHL